MERKRLGAVAAMPQEIAPLLSRIGRFTTERVSGFNLYRFSLGTAHVALIESGMGPAHATAATRALIGAARPSAIVNFGFAGGVLPGLEVGDLVLAERAHLFRGEAIAPAECPDARLSALVAAACQEAGLELRHGSFVTACGIVDKRGLPASVTGGMALPVLEMETAAVLAEARLAGIPALALRGVSDAADEELGFSIEELCDAQLNLSPWRIVLMLVRKPYLVPQLLRLAGNSRRAGRKLAQAVVASLRALSAGDRAG